MNRPLGALNLATFIFLTCPFHFWHLLCTTTIFMTDKVKWHCHARSLLSYCFPTNHCLEKAKYTVNSLLMDSFVKKAPVQNGQLVSIHVLSFSHFLVSKPSISWTPVGASPDGVHLRELTSIAKKHTLCNSCCLGSVFERGDINIHWINHHPTGKCWQNKLVYLNNRVFLARNYRLIVVPRKFDVLKTNICPLF